MICEQNKLFQEFDRQVNNLIQKRYPKILKISEKEFVNHISIFKDKLSYLTLPETDLENGKIPFVVVVKSQFMAAESMMQLVDKNGKNGTTILRPLTSSSFRPIESITIPDGIIYLLLDIDRGKSSINLPPSEAIHLIENSGRSPLTIEEGIALVTHYPDFLLKNNCYSLLASRTGTDQRVPAIWINAKKEPNLGWCWDGNPHTWLGSTSCAKRVAALDTKIL